MLQTELDQVIEEESKNRQEVCIEPWFPLYSFVDDVSKNCEIIVILKRFSRVW